MNNLAAIPVPLSFDDPARFLSEIDDIDTLAALRVADAWIGTGSMMNQHNAAWSFVLGLGTRFPVCYQCYFPIVEGWSHDECQDAHDEDDRDEEDECCPECGEHTCVCHDEDDVPSYGEVLSSAYRHYGNMAQAKEAVRDDPGSFI